MSTRLLSCIATLLLVSTCASAQEASTPTSSTQDNPSVQSIVDQLKVKDDGSIDTGTTRSLRLGGASATTRVAEPEPSSISMQIQFAFNSDRIEGASATTMSNLAMALASDELKGRSFQIVGHTDGVGAASYNMHLSQMRAASVKRYLVQHGVSADRLSASGKGANQLLNSADPTAAENRRVEIVASGG